MAMNRIKQSLKPARLGPLALWLSLCGIAAASATQAQNTTHPGMAFSQTKTTELTKSELNYLFDDMDEIKPNVWDNWGLTKTEWEKYETIKTQTAWATWEGNPSPLQLLAIYSSDIEVKKRYARLEAQLEQWRLTKALEYQTIYTAEARVLAARYQEFMASRRRNAESLTQADRVALFIDATSDDCNARCTSMVARLLRKKPQLTIFAVGTQSQTQVFSWAKNAGIPEGAVQSGLITLNFEKGEYEQLTRVPATFGAFPAAFVMRDGQWQTLSL